MLLILLTFIMTWRKLEHGILIVLAELFVGGKGYLYSLTLGHARLSIRIVLFVTVMLVWLLRRSYRQGSWPGIVLAVRKWILLIGLAVGWGVVAGLMAGHGWAAVFFDANAYLYFAFIFVLASPSLNWRQLGPRLIALIAAAATVLGLKSLVSLTLFVKLQIAGLTTFYRWIRETGVGEVAPIFGGTYRVFFQSQVYGLLGLSVIVPWLFPPNRVAKSTAWLFIPITLGLAAVLVSLSRSFWLGGGVGLLAALIIGIVRYRWRLPELAKVAVVSLGVFAMAYTLTSWALNFPYPFPLPGRPTGTNILNQRIATIGGEAAAKSRAELFRALLPVIKRRPWFGYGFGKTVTYQSSDPRQLQSASGGVYTTYAFELGYFDMAIKFGFIGLISLMGFLVVLAARLWRKEGALAFGFLVGTITLSVIHLTTPYINHPLGIGFLLLAATLGLVQTLEKA